MSPLGIECLQHMDPHTFIGEQRVADTQHETFHAFNLTVQPVNNKQADYPVIKAVLHLN